MGDVSDKPNPFETVIQACWPRIYQVAMRMTGNAVEAEEVAQQTFFQAFQAWDRFEGKAQPDTWLFRIAVNACRKHMMALWLARMSQERLKDPNLIHTMRRVQEWAKSFPTRAIGWMLLLLFLFGFLVCTYVDVGWNESKPFLWTFIPTIGVSWLAERWILWWTRRRDRELWDWWEGKAEA